MYHTNSFYCLMKALSCNHVKDSRVWVYLYDAVLSLDKPNTFMCSNMCDLKNALLGYDHVFNPEDWIAQLLLVLNVQLDTKAFCGYGIVGKDTYINLSFREGVHIL